jgi:hypothetical protein
MAYNYGGTSREEIQPALPVYGVYSTPVPGKVTPIIQTPIKKIDLSAQSDDFSLQPAQSSVLGDWWKGSGVVDNYNKYGNHADSTVNDPGSPKAIAPQGASPAVAASLPVPMDMNEQVMRSTGNASNAPDTIPGVPPARRQLENALQMYPNSGAATLTAAGKESDINKETARLSDLGFSKLMTPGSAPDGALPNKTMVKADAPIKGSDLPKDLQAAYAQQGIEIDPNALYEKMSYGNVEGKGSAVGYRKFDPNRQQGTFSVTPGLSDAERQQVAQIDENQARQAAYGVSRKTGELYDAAQQHQQQQAALSALKQMQMQQEQGRFKATYDQKDAEIAQRNQQHADTMDWRAAELNQKELASKRGAVKPLAPLPNALDYLKVFDANPLTMQLPQEQKEDLALKGLGVVDDETKPIFRSKAKPGKVFIRNPDKSITELSLQNFLDFENIRRGRPQQGYFQQEAGAQQDR